MLWRAVLSSQLSTKTQVLQKENWKSEIKCIHGADKITFSSTIRTPFSRRSEVGNYNCYNRLGFLVFLAYYVAFIVASVEGCKQNEIYSLSRFRPAEIQTLRNLKVGLAKHFSLTCPISISHNFKMNFSFPMDLYNIAFWNENFILA